MFCIFWDRFYESHHAVNVAVVGPLVSTTLAQGQTLPFVSIFSVVNS